MPRRLPLALSSLLLVSPACAQSSKHVTAVSKRYKLRNGASPKGPMGHAIAYDARGRGAYLASNDLVKLCAEPPPDVTANLESQSSFALNLEALAEYEAFKAAIDSASNASQSASSTVGDAATRTELVLFMRDALYRVCEMHFNKVLDKDEAKDAFLGVIAAGRALGQRDNLAKLIDLAEAMMESDSPDPALIHDVIGTIRFLAAADYFMASGNGDDSVIVNIMLSTLLGEKNIQEARLAMTEKLKSTKAKAAEAKAKAEKAATDAAAASGQARRELEAAAKELKTHYERAVLEHQTAVDVYQQTFGINPPTDALFDPPPKTEPTP